jgi:hypothetical protein
MDDEMKSGLVDVIVLVSAKYPTHLIQVIPFQTIVISDDVLYEAIRPMNMLALFKSMKLRWIKQQRAEANYVDALPFENALSAGIKHGYVYKRDGLIRLSSVGRRLSESGVW